MGRNMRKKLEKENVFVEDKRKGEGKCLEEKNGDGKGGKYFGVLE